MANIRTCTAIAGVDRRVDWCICRHAAFQTQDQEIQFSVQILGHRRIAVTYCGAVYCADTVMVKTG